MYKKTSKTVILFILTLNLTFASASSLAHAQSDYEITLLSQIYDPVEDEHYFEYRVECISSHGVSHITFEMKGNCNPDVDDDVIVDAWYVDGVPLQAGSPEIIDSSHPQAPPVGLKYDFEDSIEPGQYSVIYFTLKGEWVPDGTIPVEVKAGENIVLLTAEGPDCKPPDFVIPENPWGVAGTMLAMLAAVALLANGKGLNIKP